MSRVPNATLVDRVDLQISKDCGLTCFPCPTRSLANSTGQPINMMPCLLPGSCTIGVLLRIRNHLSPNREMTKNNQMKWI